MNILIVEDEGITALFLKEIISDLGHTIVGVYDNAEDALNCVYSLKVDIVFMDIQINGALDGLQTANKIVQTFSDIGIIFLTSFKDSQTIAEAQFVKPLGYMIKPVVESDVEAILMVAKSHYTRNMSSKNNMIVCNGYVYHCEMHDLYYKDEYIALSSKEQRCFHALIINKDAHISVEQLMYSIWEDDRDHISSLRELTYRLRKKIPHLTLTNTPNVGYILLSS